MVKVSKRKWKSVEGSKKGAEGKNLKKGNLRKPQCMSQTNKKEDIKQGRRKRRFYVLVYTL